jgi:hypothetical protein
MAIQIRTTPAILSTNVTKPSVSIEQPKAIVDGSLTFAKIKVEGTLPKVQIDQDQAFNESGLKNVEAFSADYVAYAKQKFQESVGRIAEQGTQLTDVHLGGNPIADQAFYNAFDQFYNEFGMVTMPTSGPEITVQEGTLDITVQPGEISGQIRAQKPVINYKPGKVERYMEQYNSISIRYVGKNVDISV